MNSNKQTQSKFKILSFLVAILIAAVGVQSYYLYKMHQSVRSNPTQQPEQPTHVIGVAPPANTPSITINRSNHPPVTITLPSVRQGTMPPAPTTSQPINNWDPFEEMAQMQNQMNRLFSSAFGKLGESYNLMWVPHYYT